MTDFNKRWRRHLKAGFAVTLGDEFQCLLASPEPIWEIAHFIRYRFPEADWVVACGRGGLTTRLHPNALAPELDGPCFHLAREALEFAKRQRLVFAFRGFDDNRLAGLAAYYSALYWSWTRRQRRAANDWRVYWDPVEASLKPTALKKLHPSSISHLRRRMAWALVREGDKVFRELLNQR